MWTDKYKKAVAFSYDDGIASDRKLVPILNQYGIKGTFNINTEMGPGIGTWTWSSEESTFAVERITIPEMLELYKGHEVAVHGCMHLNWTELNEQQLEQEIKKDYDTIRALFGDTKSFAYPYGVWNEKSVAYAKSIGLQFGRTVEPSHNFELPKNPLAFSPTCHHNDEQVMELIDQFLKLQPDTPQVFVLWGHSYEFDGKQNWEHLEEICKRLGGHDDIFYGSVSEVYDI